MARYSVIQQKARLSSRIGSFFNKIFLEQKLDNWLGYALIICISVAFGYFTAKEPMAGIGVVGGSIALLIAVICITNTMAALYIIAGYAFFIYFFSRLFFNGLFPIGIVTDILILCTFLGLFIRRINWRHQINQFTKSQIGLWVLVLFLYLAIQLFNPNAKSFDGWYQAFRKTLGAILLLFICFNVFTSRLSVKNYITFLFVICTLAGIYGCVQQWHGFFPFEMKFVLEAQPGFSGVIDPNYRKFSTFPDCSAFGVVMAAASVFFTLIAVGQENRSIRSIILTGVLFMLCGMGFSGTRTANAMLVAGFFMFCLITFDRKSTKIFSFVAGAILLIIIYGPFYSNQTINRFRTTFKASNDASYQLREQNRSFIQPYIYSHPIGGGLGTTGGIGAANNPGHFLAGFSPDGSYLQKALETGWVGLVMVCILYFVILKHSIIGYFRSKMPDSKLIYAAVTSCLFAFYVGEYAQVAIGQITDIVVYYPLVAIVLRLHSMDDDPAEGPILNV